MTKLIAILIIALALFTGWRFYLHWEKIHTEGDTKKQAAAPVVVQGDSLPGMPQHLDASYRAAKEKGATTFRAWLKSCEGKLQDPRKAWIELEFCVAVARENPAEAKVIFASVKQRTPPSSPVWPKMKELEKTFE